MDSYTQCVEYLHALGLPMEACEKVCKKYEAKGDMKGLVDYMLLCETIAETYVD